MDLCTAKTSVSTLTTGPQTSLSLWFNLLDNKTMKSWVQTWPLGTPGLPEESGSHWFALLQMLNITVDSNDIFLCQGPPEAAYPSQLKGGLLPWYQSAMIYIWALPPHCCLTVYIYKSDVKNSARRHFRLSSLPCDRLVPQKLMLAWNWSNTVKKGIPWVVFCVGYPHGALLTSLKLQQNNILQNLALFYFCKCIF